MKFRSGGILISINIQEPDIYVFDNVSGGGKSYLCSLMKEAKRAGKPYGGYTYEDYLNGVDIVKYAEGLKVLMVDRYNMYSGKESIIKSIENISKNCIVLLDAKYEYDFACEFCDITRTATTIEVEGL